MPDLRALVTIFLLGGLLLAGSAAVVVAEDEAKPVERVYATAPDAPAKQSLAEAEAKSAGCRGCHTRSDHATMHANPGVVLGCTDCHGGDASVLAPAGSPVSSLVRAAKYSQRESVRWASGMRRIAASAAPQSLRAIASRACHSCSDAS